MLVIAQTKTGRYYRTIVSREVRKLPKLEENDIVERVFESGNIHVRKARGYPP